MSIPVMIRKIDIQVFQKCTMLTDYDDIKVTIHLCHSMITIHVQKCTCATNWTYIMTLHKSVRKVQGALF